MDKTTGREQGLTIQGASALSEAEINRMIQEAEQFSDYDREKRERIEKRNRAEAMTFQAERQLREVALDFGMQFANQYRRRIESLVDELRDCLKRDDERGIDIAQADLQDALYDLRKEVYQFAEEEEDDGFFGTIKRTITGDRDSYDRDLYGRDSFGRDPYSRNPYDRDPYSRDSYGRDSYGRDSYSRDSYDRDSYGRDSYGRDSYNRGLHGMSITMITPDHRNLSEPLVVQV